MKRKSTFLLLFLAVVVFATWQYRLLCILSLVLLNKEWIRSRPWMAKHKHAFKGLVASLLLAIFVAIPNYVQRGRTQLLYIDRNGHRTATPVPLYLLNALFPEEEVMNFCMKATALMPPTGSTGTSLLRDAQRDFWTGKALGFYTPYNLLSLQGSNPGSLVISQACNQVLGTNYKGTYIIKPRNYSASKRYPVVFFAHGYLGNWELYQGVLGGLENCFVVSFGTRNLSGFFDYKDIDEIFSSYLPLLENEGYQLDRERLHLMGLSNGGTAANVALRQFDRHFQSITFISTACQVAKHTSAKVLFVGGGKDAASAGMRAAAQRLRNCGTKTALFFDENENHYIIVYKRSKMIDFLNEEMELKSER